ncbi:MAG TPA: S41 family peptidase [Pyrinomonadaceae bacterium]|nr:S41 family peptidase [Pyrinomonadaceae bacterium]
MNKRQYLSLSLSKTIFALLCVAVTASFSLTTARAQSQLGPYDRSNASTMLDALKDDLKNNYYDPNFRGMDLEARFKETQGKIKQAQTRDQLIIALAQFMLDLNDSHTFFIPPSRSASVEYGWEMQMIGDNCFVTAVKPKTDAEAKGLKTGDAILAVDGYKPSRDNLWKMYYRYYALMPTRSIRLLVQSPNDAQPREIDVLSKIEQGAAVTDWGNLFVRWLKDGGDVDHDRFYEVGDELLIWKMPTFVVSESHVDAIMARARKYKSLIIDLRGNGGGYVDTLSRLVSNLFDRDVNIAALKGRKKMKPILAKTRGKDVFKGQLVVLVDSESGSASEVLARVVQLEKRGTVIGDRSAGAVMTADHYGHETGVGRVLYFGSSITIADMVMSDGKSLENVGVSPDELLLPKGADLAAKRDPVLARAAESLGIKLDAEKAGTLFPKEWKK